MPAKKSHKILNEARDIAAWIDAGLKRPGKSQRALAEVLGVTTTIVARLRIGKRNLLAQELRTVADYLGSSPPMIPVELQNFHDEPLTPILGRIGSEVTFEESHEFAPRGDEETIPSAMLAPEFKGLAPWAMALYIDDNSMDLGGIPKGALVVYVPYWKFRKRLFAGDIVIYRYEKLIKAGEKKARKTVYCIRRVIETKTGYELSPQTSAGKSKYRSFYLSKGQSRYSDRQRDCIIGRVISSFVDFRDKSER